MRLFPSKPVPIGRRTLPILVLVAATHAATPRPLHCIVLNVTDTSAFLQWGHRSGAVSSCNYGPTLDYGFVVEVDDPGARRIQLRNLSPSTRYFYNLTRDDTLLLDHPRSRHFSTAPADNDETVVFAVIGDTRGSDESLLSDHRAVIQSIVDESYPRFLIHTGDLTGDDGFAAWERFLSAEERLLRQCPIFPVRGNSDLDPDRFRRRFAIPTADRVSEQVSYAIRFGAVFCVNLEILRRRTAGYYEETIGSSTPQYAWLEGQLRSERRRQCPFTIVSFYAPVFDPTERTNPKLREIICPLLERHGVDMVFNGGVHSFFYVRNKGVDYVVTGGGGAELEHPRVDSDFPGSFSYTAFHHLRITVRRSVLDLQAVDRSGTVFFSHSIEAGGAGRSVAEKNGFEERPVEKSGSATSIIIYGTPDCEDCRHLRHNILPGIPAPESLDVTLVDVSGDSAFEAYKVLETRFNSRHLAFPVVRIGDMLLSGDKLHPDTIALRLETMRAAPARPPAFLRRAALVAVAMVIAAVAAGALTIRRIRKRLW